MDEDWPDEDQEEFVVIVEPQELEAFVRSIHQAALEAGYTFVYDNAELPHRVTVH